VVAAASSRDKLDVALAMGADAGVIYPGSFDAASEGKAFTEAVRSACGGQGPDVVVDPVGGAYAEPAFRSVAWQARYLVVGFAAGIPSIPLNLVLLKGAQIIGVFWGSYMARSPHRGSDDMKALLDLFAEGRVNPLVSERFSLERGGEAIARLASRSVHGKVVVEIVGSEDRMSD
jgi:NADPH2:quinone reductase